MAGSRRFLGGGGGEMRYVECSKITGEESYCLTFEGIIPETTILDLV